MYTSYFGNIRKLPKDLILVSIADKTPDIDGVIIFNEVAPGKELLSDWKKGKISKATYLKRYFNYILFPRSQQKIICDLVEVCFKSGLHKVDLSKVCFLCYEKYLDENNEIVFCHRHAFANYMNADGNCDIREWGF